MSLEIVPVTGLPPIEAGDDLAALIADALPPLAGGDVVVVTQKVVSKAEARVVPGPRDAQVAAETRRVVARRDDLVIAETRHGFVCANAGVDASNIADGFVSLLPEDPDASARGLSERLGVPVVITDTFGRPWRRGLVDVAIGCAGIPALDDLRGRVDHTGRELEATVMAFADQVAAAAGLVMSKDAMVPVAVVRGLEWSARPSPASHLVRPPEEDLFRESPLQSLASRRTIRSFGSGPVERDAIRTAVETACYAPSPHHTRPWTFVALDSQPAKRALLAAMRDAWRRDLEADGLGAEAVAERLRRSEAVFGAAPALVVPLLSLADAQDYPDEDRRRAERDMFVLAGGAAVQNLLLAFHAQGLAAAWVSSGLFCRDEVLAVLGLGNEWNPLGTVAVGPLPEVAPRPRPDLDLDAHLRFD